MKRQLTKKQINRRYYLHRKSKELGLKIKNKLREITSDDEDLLQHKYALSLSSEYGYMRQLSIK